MMTSAGRLVAAYLERLEEELTPLPAHRRAELVSEIAEHIEASLSTIHDPTEADVRMVLDRIGDPRDIAHEAGVIPPPPPAAAPPSVAPRALLERLTLVALPFGGLFVPVIGWLIAVAMLWSSSLWTTRDKLVGTLVIPGGYSWFPFLALSLIEPCATDDCASTAPLSEQLIFTIGITGPLVGAIYLAYRLRSARRCQMSG